MTHTLDRYEEKLMGLPYPVVLLDAAEEVTHPKTGKVLGVAIPDAEEMAAAVALALCFMPTRLTGAPRSRGPRATRKGADVDRTDRIRSATS